MKKTKFLTKMLVSLGILALGAGGLTTGLVLSKNSGVSDSVTNTDSSSFVKVPELWTSSAGFNETNVQDLFNKINGASGTTFAQIKSLANSKMTASQIRAKTYGKTSSQDIEVVLGGLEWEVVYLSTDTDGNAILTLWLDNNQQSGWTGKSQTEGAFYGFYDGGLYSDWAADWYTATTSQGTAAFYPSAMYGTSYIRAVTLNNGGQYATSNTALTTAYQSSSSVFAPFTMSSSGLYNYIVTPAKVSWQEKQSATATGVASGSYDYPNDEWNPSTEKGKYYSDEYNYVEHNGNSAWKDDKIWLPSITETGYNDSHLGLWGVSIDQRKNYNGSTSRISGQKVGSSNTQNTSNLYTYSWLRSGSSSYAYLAYFLYPSGSDITRSIVYDSYAVRPALHLNLTKVAETVGLITWTDFASGKDFANSGHQGTESDPYEISSAEDLAQLAVDVNDGNKYEGKYFVQTANIKLGGYDWTPIGRSSSNAFSGNYDGQNYKIEGITIDSTEDYQGLFGYINGSANQKLHINNVVLQGGSVKGGHNVGGIVGYSSNAYISNCKSNVSIDGVYTVGGIAGHIITTQISSCENYGNVRASSSPGSTTDGGGVGGIAGFMNSASNIGLISQCYNAGDVSGVGYVGGLVGAAYYQPGDITKSIANCTVTASGDYVSGLAGYYDVDRSRITQCAFFGTIHHTGSSTKIGAFGNSSKMIACSFYGTSNVPIAMETGLTACWVWCNSTKKLSGAVDSTWTTYWALVPNLNDGLPVQKELYSIASAATTTESELKQYFSSWS